jgi:glycerol-3-phosphate dehydrogenase (NAD(P)+)
MNLTVLGAGAWGTALAASAAPRHPTLLWARDAAQATQMRTARTNARYLAGITLPEELRIENDFGAALAHARQGFVIVATPMAALGEMLARIAGHGVGVLWLCKGFEPRRGLLGHELARDAMRDARVGVLSGPSFAIEVARGQPTALVAASADASLCEAAVDALHGEGLRIYTSDDPVGVEVGGAVKNVLAIATGIADGMALGLNARAALITRGLAEMTRLGVALGAKAETFMGLSGLGDLVLTATGDLSRNRKVGLLLAQGRSLSEATASLGHVAEGVLCARAVVQRALSLGVDMPIAQCVVALLDGKLQPAQAVALLMGREAVAENTPLPKSD